MGARPDPQIDPTHGDPPMYECGHLVDALPADHPTPEVCIYRARRAARCRAPYPRRDTDYTEPCFLPTGHVDPTHANGWRRWDA